MSHIQEKVTVNAGSIRAVPVVVKWPPLFRKGAIHRNLMRLLNEFSLGRKLCKMSTNATCNMNCTEKDKLM